ncbi:hypothetical protein TRFO_27624 [Tritrichomonas foetus]|uniref:Uncharacterized protein n=1 Tax=Tritrichomonas foetus TaxID=1144522 RepID=A0A1J4K217_9EUKA|nr:hypothetical protein TRFO_27624 [Tritrichomonas foetus]|eukprot:OHT04832.1 hypothetical protein TRFO_27624 [Tritrichomonas foetus]
MKMLYQRRNWLFSYDMSYQKSIHQMTNHDIQNLMNKAPLWLDEFYENIQNIAFLKERINLPAWIHLSPSRLTELLDQIDKKTSSNGSAQKGWPRIVSRFTGTDRADSIFGIIEYGLREPSAYERVLQLLVELIINPTLRLYLEPLIDETLFMVRCSEHRLVDLLEYYLSFRCTIDKGTLPFDVVKKNYNEKILRFQSCIYQNLPKEEKTNEKNINPLVTTTISQLNDPFFMERYLSELNFEVFQKLKEEFGIYPICETPEEDVALSIAGLTRLLASPVNPLDNIPKFLMPTKYPPHDIVVPHFGRHALCLSDAVLQVFQEKRVEVANKVLNFIESVKNDVNPENEERYNKNAVPLLVSPAISSMPGYDDDKCFSIIFDPQFLNYGFLAPVEKDMIYLLNSVTGQFSPYIVIKKTTDSSFIAHIESQDVPVNDFNICIKLPERLIQEINKIINLPPIIVSPNISQPIVDSFIGFASPTRPPIEIVETPLGSSSSIDAANWLANNFSESIENSIKKTIVFATSPKEFDIFVSQFCSQVKIPQMYILRLDLNSDACIEIVLNSRKQLLQYAASIDKSYGFSCAAAINSLKLYCSDQVDLIKHLEMVRPLEYIADNQKRIDYLKESTKIICHLIGEPLKVTKMKFDNCLILDTCQIEDSDMLNILNNTNPDHVRLYGYGQCYQRLQKMPDDVIHKDLVNSFKPKNKEIMNFLRGIYRDDITQDHVGSTLNQSYDNEVQTPAVLTPCHLWECNEDNVFEVAVASAFLLKMLGFESILIVAEDCYLEKIEMIIRKRASWNKNLLIVDSLKSVDEVVTFQQSADAVIYAEISKSENTRIGDVANSAKHVFWGCVCKSESMEIRGNNEFPLQEDSILRLTQNERFIDILNNHVQKTASVAFNERFGEEIPESRSGYTINDVNHLFGLVYHMQIQLSESAQN